MHGIPVPKPHTGVDGVPEGAILGIAVVGAAVLGSAVGSSVGVGLVGTRVVGTSDGILDVGDCVLHVGDGVSATGGPRYTSSRAVAAPHTVPTPGVAPVPPPE